MHSKGCHWTTKLTKNANQDSARQTLRGKVPSVVCSPTFVAGHSPASPFLRQVPPGRRIPAHVCMPKSVASGLYPPDLLLQQVRAWKAFRRHDSDQDAK